MPPPTQVCIRDSIAAIEASTTQPLSLKAAPDATQAAIQRSRALLAPEIPDRAVAAILNANKAEDEDKGTASQRVAIHLLGILRAAGYACKLGRDTSH